MIYTGFLCSQFAFIDQKFLVGSRCATSNVIQNSMPWKLLNKGYHHKKTPQFNFKQQMWPCGRKAWEWRGEKKGFFWLLSAIIMNSVACWLSSLAVLLREVLCLVSVQTDAQFSSAAQLTGFLSSLALGWFQLSCGFGVERGRLCLQWELSTPLHSAVQVFSSICCHCSKSISDYVLKPDRLTAELNLWSCMCIARVPPAGKGRSI